MEWKTNKMIDRISTLKKQLFSSIRKNYVIVTTIAFFIFLVSFFSAMNIRFFSFYNLQNLIRQAAVLLIVSLGETYIILSGSIDLSVPGIVSLGGILTAKSVLAIGNLSILVGPILGLVAGLANGLIFTMTKVPSFLVTLGMYFILDGLGLYVSRGRPIVFRNQNFQNFGAGSFLGIPILGIWALGVFLVAIFIAKYTRLGRYIYFIGGGEKVANLCGVPIVFYKVLNFTFAGVLYGLSSSLLTARMGSGWPNMGGTSLLLDTFAAVVMGGTALSGGVGSPAKTIIGVVIIAILSNGMNIIGVNSYLQIIIKGIAVIVAVAVTIDRSKIGLLK